MTDSSSLPSTSTLTSDTSKSATESPADCSEVVTIADDESLDSDPVIDRSKNNQIPSKPSKTSLLEWLLQTYK